MRFLYHKLTFKTRAVEPYIKLPRVKAEAFLTNIYNRLKDFTNPETINLEIWSANNKPNAIAPAISVTSSMVLIAVLKFNNTKFSLHRKLIHLALTG